MNDQPNTQTNTDAEVYDAITAFEQILQAMPSDRVALQALYEAHEQIGNFEEALGYLTRLAHTVADENDGEVAESILASLKKLSDGSEAAKTAIKRIEAVIPQSNRKKTAAVHHLAKGRKPDITSEMSLAWNLLQAGELTESDYSQVVDDLSENLSKKLSVPVSVLHVLSDRGAKNVERVMGFLSKDTGVPPIALRSFELQSEAYGLLPLEFMQRNAAIPFDTMGSDVLIATLNPYDKDLQVFVSEIVGRRCHYYLVHPTDYDSALETIETALKNAAV